MERTVVSEIVCQKIRLVDSQGDTVAVLGTEETEGTESPTPIFQMYNAEGLAALELSVDSQGAGSVVVFNKHEKPAVAVQVDSDEDSGEISVWRDGEIMARVTSDADGGSIRVHSTKGVFAVDVYADTDGGNLAVRGDGETAVHIYSDNEGGQVALINKDGHDAVLAGADADGGGTVLTLEDGNVTSRMPRGGR